ncbi:MAG: bifunctional molybdopterin-guanine dinucleotide biosynthesis adaptor protein MobB/molybdopterin molybdotransferase MoeA [Xanthomonadales bacterium]|nr:bifunctional molybdopterin-guanine dinucleotide biosynthesis adaptor protein MobB/molybdopterin molybdotransferase MoeA [Xanthomonadales bacterium]
MNFNLPILGFSAWSGVGKTTLLEKLIPQLAELGIRVGLIKHAHHEFDIDKPGKDSYRLRKAGANPVLIISDKRLALMCESASAEETNLENALTALPTNSDFDLLLVEGFKNADIPKIVLLRQNVTSERDTPTALPNRNVIAVACDDLTKESIKSTKLQKPLLDINQIDSIAEFICQWLKQPTSPGHTACAKGMSLQAGLELIHQQVEQITQTECLELSAAHGRILANTIKAEIEVPSDDNSAMDGYACRYADIKSVAEPCLTVVGESTCGGPFAGSVNTGECVRILTGGVLPVGCDMVIMQEQSNKTGESIHFKAADDRPFRQMQHVRLAGEDIGKGARVALSQQCLEPALMGVLASVGIAEVRVLRRPRVAFITNGSELVSLGGELARGQCFDSNRYSLLGLLAQAGVDVLDLGIVADDPAALEDAIQIADTKADLVITTGGISVGDTDFVKPVIDKLGKILFSGLQIKPGHPVTFAKLPQSVFFGLPGNPVAVMVCFSQLVLPAIRQLCGQQQRPALTLMAHSSENIRKLPGRFEFVRGILSQDQRGKHTVRRAGKQGSAILTTMSRANCFILLDEDCAGVCAGQRVCVQPFL